MNNVNGAALLARVKVGDLVTIRTHTGAQLTGRARNATGTCYLEDGSGMPHIIRPNNILRVQSRG